jgi:2-oxoglutarate dehydrogenase E2 component (dihydrolipoamide succinyltransferase)
MANVEIKVPALGESETEATLVSWLKQKGDAIEVDEVIAEVESDKITMEITAFEAGVLKEVRHQPGETVTPGQVIGVIDTSAARPRKATKPVKKAAPVAAKAAPEPAVAKEKPAAPRPETPSAEAQPAAKPAPVARMAPKAPPVAAGDAQGRQEERLPLSNLRRRTAERLKQAQNTAAMLTTFNEVNMQPVMDLRARYREAFKARHGVDLGFMSFFVRACAEAARRFPAVNAYIDGDEVVYHNYMDVGVAVSTDKGLVVPVLRGAESTGMAEIERRIADFAHRAREGGLSPDELKGGTFSITNGGVFGSLMSTPILNPPQSAILGMHAIKKRPVVENDAIVIRPMMYLALTYDHRLIDGRDAVQFLVAVKDFLEYPGGVLLDL